MAHPDSFANLELITGGDPVLDIELLVSFLVTSREYVTNMAHAHKSDDADMWNREAHALKGGAFNLGADELGEMCQAAQSEAKSPRRGEILEKIQKEFARLEIVIDERLREKQAQVRT